MTVAVALLCADGALIASDSMGASGLLASRMTKIRCCGGQPLMWTWAGSDYLGQQVGRALERWAADGEWPGPAGDAHADAERVVDVVRDATTAALGPLLPPHDPDQAAHAEFIVAGRSPSSTFVVHIRPDLSWELAGDDRLVAIGGGHQYAAVARSLMHHYIEGGLNLEQAQAVIHRAIQTVCEVSAYGVALPVQMGVMTPAGAQVLEPDEIDAIGIAVDRWKTMERETLLGIPQTDEAAESPPRLGTRRAS